MMGAIHVDGSVGTAVHEVRPTARPLDEYLCLVRKPVAGAGHLIQPLAFQVAASLTRQALDVLGSRLCTG